MKKSIRIKSIQIKKKCKNEKRILIKILVIKSIRIKKSKKIEVCKGKVYEWKKAYK